MTREEVIKSLETAVKNFERYSGDEYGREYDYARVGVDVLEDALALLKALRCKDCKFYYGVNEECGCNGGYHSEDWYCADGERRDDDATD